MGRQAAPERENSPQSHSPARLRTHLPCGVTDRRRIQKAHHASLPIRFTSRGFRRHWRWPNKRHEITLNRVAALTLLLIVAACRRESNPAELYSRARDAYQRGDLPIALNLTNLALRQGRTAPGLEWHWNFLLLQSQIKIHMASAAEVLAQISTPIEDPKLRPLEARRLTVLANAAWDNSFWVWRSAERFTK